MMADAWLDRYHEYERRSREAFKMPPGPERDQAFADAEREYAEHMAVAQEQFESDAFDEAKAELWASILLGKPTPPEVSDWLDFFENIDAGKAGTAPRPKTPDQVYAIGRFLWLRNRRYSYGCPISRGIVGRATIPCRSQNSRSLSGDTP